VEKAKEGKGKVVVEGIVNQIFRTSNATSAANTDTTLLIAPALATLEAGTVVLVCQGCAISLGMTPEIHPLRTTTIATEEAIKEEGKGKVVVEGIISQIFRTSNAMSAANTDTTPLIAPALATLEARVKA